ncbi:MAG TPA: XRE family transcriptional regulator [Selenomonadales bacterium]|nr:XRE family transcriptional regulator [Selenomonadales bacterium]
MSFGYNLKYYRKQCSLSLRELSERSGVSKTMLSEIEREKKTPTITVAGRIADALSISLPTLMGSLEPVKLSVIRKNEQPPVTDPVTLISRQLVSPYFATSDIEISILTMPGGTTTGRIPAHKSGSKEYAVVTKGCVEITVETDGTEETYGLAEGDSFYFEANVDHLISNTGPAGAEIFIVLRKPFP